MTLIDQETGEVLDRDLVGTLGLLERDAEGLVLVDLKTSARKYTDLQVEASLQLSVYSYAVGLSSFAGGDGVRLRFDVLTKTRVLELHRYWATRDRAANVRLFRLVAEVLGAIGLACSSRSSGGSARTACFGASAGRGSEGFFSAPLVASCSERSAGAKGTRPSARVRRARTAKR